ncbi:MAG: transglutaminase family protein [Cyclobacteriaceae bacterium]
MPKYQITYNTLNTYETEVSEATFALMVMPQDNELQKLWKTSFTNSLGELFYSSINPFGFTQTLLHTRNHFTRLEINLEASLNVAEQNPFDFTPITLDESMEKYNSVDFFVDHHHFLLQTKFTNPGDEELDDACKATNSPSVFEFLMQLNSYIHDNYEFDTVETDVHTTALEIIRNKRGVCQDFAHFFIGVCRANKIPARYVSGYINQGQRYAGDAAMHAWVEVFLPEKGWIGFDPTNNILIDHNFIKVCHGADYSDCSPIKGVLKTTGANKTGYTVTVQQQ